MSKYNQIVGETWFNTDETKIEIFITVSNTYPIFLKIQQDAQNGIYLYENLKGTTYTKDNILRINYEKVNTSLIEFIKTIYPAYKSTGWKSFETIYESYGYSIEIVTYFNYKLIFLRTSMHLILLNYVSAQTDLSSQNINDYLIPSGITNEKVHVQEIKYMERTYKAINTFIAFIPYAKYCNSIPSLGFNHIFFRDFQSAISKEMFNSNAQQQVILDHTAKNGFWFYVLNNIIIIGEYFEGLNELIEISPFSSNSIEEDDDINPNIFNGSSCCFCGGDTIGGSNICPDCENNID